MNVVYLFYVGVIVSLVWVFLLFIPNSVGLFSVPPRFLPAMLCSELWGSTGYHMDSKWGFCHCKTLLHFTSALLS